MTHLQAFGTIEQELKAVEDVLRQNVRSRVSLVPKVGRYVFDSGGKRIRPSLLLLSARLCGYRPENDGGMRRPVHLACVMELLHSATLLHDDVVDGAHVRRGLASVNSVWGNRVSILMGDYLFSRASTLFVEDGDTKIMRILARTINAMVEGELIQLNSGLEVKASERHCLSIISKKTATLFSACCECGAAVGGGTPAEEKALRSFGLSLGIAFQVIDDSLDYSHPKSFGKALGTDLKNGKLTLPLVYVLKECSPKEKRAIKKILTSKNPSDNGLGRVLDLLRKYNGLERSEKTAQDYIGQAKNCLAGFSPSRERDALLWIADYAVRRKT